MLIFQRDVDYTVKNVLSALKKLIPITILLSSSHLIMGKNPCNYVEWGNERMRMELMVSVCVCVTLSFISTVRH